MHVVIIPSTNFFPERGMGIFEYHQAHALYRNGHKVGIISAGYNPFRTVFNKKRILHKSYLKGIPVYKYFSNAPIPLRFINKLGLYNQRKNYRELFEEYISEHGRPELIHAHNSLFSGYEAKFISAAFNIPFVITEHDSSHARHLLNTKLKQVSIEALSSSNAVISVSTFQKKYLEELLEGCNRDITVIPNMIDPELECSFDESALRTKNNQISFISIGSLDRNKNQEVIIRGFAAFLHEHKDTRLILVGDGPERERLMRLVRKLAITNKVFFTGHIDRNELADILRKSDFYIHASKVETFGISMIEALHFGKPVITTKSGGPSDFINEDNGTWLDEPNIKSVKEAMHFMVRNKGRFNGSKISSDIAVQFGSKEICKRLSLIYKHVI